MLRYTYIVCLVKLSQRHTKLYSKRNISKWTETLMMVIIIIIIIIISFVYQKYL